MKILGLDVSTKTGFAALSDEKLGAHGLIRLERPLSSGLHPDFDTIKYARQVASKILERVFIERPDHIFIEQTNLGQNRTDQKELEFIHFALLDAIEKSAVVTTQNVHYVDTSRWRSTLKIKLTKEQKVHNKAMREDKTPVLKEYKGKITPKHLVVAWANGTYNLSLKKKDHDIADAIALASFGKEIASRSHVASTTVDKILFDMEQQAAAAREEKKAKQKLKKALLQQSV